MNQCEWLHQQLEELPVIKYPFYLEQLPNNGIYFFYEKGEHRNDGEKGRIVRIGTHKNNNFRSRINDHFLFNERKMSFDAMKPAPKDRSIFRKNLGRALLYRDTDSYLDVWNIDFTKKEQREKLGHLRDIEKEKSLERKITDILQSNFSFRFIIIDTQTERMGSEGLERSLIGTVAYNRSFAPSATWLGRYSPIYEIQDSGLWQIQHLNSPPINEEEKQKIIEAIKKTEDWLKR